MKLIQATVRREKETVVVEHLSKSGFHAYSRFDVFGRGRQKGLVAGTVRYEELPKVMFLVAVKDADAERAVEAIRIAARTGNPGDGKIFVSPLLESRTVRTGARDEN